MLTIFVVSRKWFSTRTSALAQLSIARVIASEKFSQRS
jgi:hypothetical protein